MTEVDVVHRYWRDLWGGADVGLVDELFAEPYTRHNRSGTARLTRAELKEDFLRYWRSLGSAREVRLDHVTLDSEAHVWSRVTIRGLDADTGVRRVVSFLHEARLADGLIAETWTLTAAEVDWNSTGK